MFEGLPAPLQLGIIGTLLLAIVSILVYQNRLVQNGKLVPKDTVAELLAGKQRTIDDQATVITELRETNGTLESTNTTLADAVKQATDNQGWVDLVVRRAIGGSGPGPHMGDNTLQEVPGG